MAQPTTTPLYDVKKVELVPTNDSEGKPTNFIKLTIASRDIYAGAKGQFVETTFITEDQLPMWERLIVEHEKFLAGVPDKNGKPMPNPMPPMEAMEVVVPTEAYYCKDMSKSTAAHIVWLPAVHESMKVFVRCYNGVPTRDPQVKANQILAKQTDMFKLVSKGNGDVPTGHEIAPPTGDETKQDEKPAAGEKPAEGAV